MWRLRPLTLLPASYPRCPLFEAVFKAYRIYWQRFRDKPVTLHMNAPGSCSSQFAQLGGPFDGGVECNDSAVSEVKKANAIGVTIDIRSSSFSKQKGLPIAGRP